MSPALTELLRCPVTGQRLALAPPKIIEILETQRRAGALHIGSAQPQWSSDEPIEAALLREDGQVCYLVQRGIPLLLPDHGISMPA